MNGIQGTSDPGGLQPGNGGDAAGAAHGNRSSLPRLVQAIRYALEEVVKISGDQDLTRALEKVSDWCARNPGAPGEGERSG